jgi:tRNA/rRNA methyltransferase/tRNA (cytidine32/uridine32-2'-O)-methyltransferase
VASVASNPDFNSLNLAAAVQVFTYELQLAFFDGTFDPAPGSPHKGAESTTAAELEGLYSHLEQALTDIGYYDQKAPKLLMRRLRHFFARARPDRTELNILRGILTASQRAAGKSRD